MVAFIILTEQLWVVPIRYAALDQFRVFAVVYHIIDKATAFLFGVFIYHTVRQLRLVSAVNSKHVSINLFDLRPLHSFSDNVS
jgi:hypothetical protein